MPPSAINPDLALLRLFWADPAHPMPVDSNPLARALGLSLTGMDDAGVHLSCDPGALCVQGNGVIQGGAVSALLDFAMAFAVMATLDEGQNCATLTLQSDFLRAAPQGRYRMLGRVDRRARSIAFASATLMREGETDGLVAKGSSTLAIISP